MRIVTNFKDYYDCMARTDEDRETIFVRNKGKLVDFALPKDVGAPRENHGYHNCRIFGVVLFFCGKTYPLLDREEYSIGRGWHSRTIDYTEPPPAKHHFRMFRTERYGGVFSFFDEHPGVAAALVALYGPVFAVHFDRAAEGGDPEWGHVCIEPNVCLAPYGFAKIMPPPIAYNELYKFVCNMRRPERPIPEMPNDVKIHAAGFNLKTSFRREPST